MQKKALLIRLGAYGDMIMASVAIRALKEDGYHVTANVNPRSKAVLENNPNVDDYIIHEDDCVPNADLPNHWAELARGFDKVVNLSGSVEVGLLRTREDAVYHWPKALRHEMCDVNYYDKTLEIAGYPNIKGQNGELFFTKAEEEFGQMIQEKNKGKFVILWSLSGSSVHKFYPYAEFVAPKFLDERKDAVIYTVGEPACKLIEWKHERTKPRVTVWNIRQSFVMCKYADMVIGPETGILNAAGCFDTPKIVLLSHSSNENLSKYWRNCIPVAAEPKKAPCQPCHKMIYSTKDCITNSTTGLPVCTAHLEPKIVLDAMEQIYSKWEAKRGLLRV